MLDLVFLTQMFLIFKEKFVLQAKYIKIKRQREMVYFRSVFLFKMKMSRRGTFEKVMGNKIKAGMVLMA